MQCQFFSGCWPVSLIYEFNRFIYLDKLVQSGRLKYGLELNGPDLNEYQALAAKYNIHKRDSISKIKHKIWCHFDKMISGL